MYGSLYIYIYIYIYTHGPDVETRLTVVALTGGASNSSEGGITRLETLIELRLINSMFWS